MKRETSGRLMLTADVAKRCLVTPAAVRLWHTKGVLIPDRVTQGGVGVYYAENVEDFARRREGYAREAPRLKAAYGMGPNGQMELEVPMPVCTPFEGWVE